MRRRVWRKSSAPQRGQPLHVRLRRLARFNRLILRFCDAWYTETFLDGYLLLNRKISPHGVRLHVLGINRRNRGRRAPVVALSLDPTNYTKHPFCTRQGLQ